MSAGSLVLTGIGELVTNDPDRDGLLGIVRDAALAAVDGRVAWVGPAADLPSDYGDLRTMECRGRAVLPGFVDAHTHAVFAGDRADEFARRMAGEGYEEILAAGGGIYATVAATRGAPAAELVARSLERIGRMAANGTTTVEVKSGYGLDVDTEALMISVIRGIDRALPIDLVPTFLGAHVVGPEFGDRRSDYVDLVVGDMLGAVAADVAFVDVFCDPAAFDLDDARRIAAAADAAGLPMRFHADQTGRIGATDLAAGLGAASADHLDHATDDDLAALASAGTVAVLLPGVSYSLRTAPPDARRVWDSGATVAIATDCNPGTAWVETMPFVISLAVVDGRLDPDEAVWAATRGGAMALRLDDRGHLAPGARADAVILDAPSHLHLPYRPDSRLVAAVIAAGTPI